MYTNVTVIIRKIAIAAATADAIKTQRHSLLNRL